MSIRIQSDRGGRTVNQDEKDLFASLEDIFDEVDAEDKVPPVNELSDYELIDAHADVQIALKELRQLIRPHTQEARDLHSRNNAIQLELQKRGLK